MEVEEEVVEEVVVAVDCVLWRRAVSIRIGQDRMQQKPTGRALAYRGGSCEKQVVMMLRRSTRLHPCR